MDPEADNPLRVVIPDLVPDPEFVGLLAARAAASRGSATPPLARPGLGVRVAAAAAGVVLVIAGAAVMSATLAGDDSAPVPTVPVPSPKKGEQQPADAEGPPRNASPPRRPVDPGGPPAGTLDERPTPERPEPKPRPKPSGSPGPTDWPDTCEEWVALAEKNGYDMSGFDCDEARNRDWGRNRNWSWDRNADRGVDSGDDSRNNDDLGREPQVDRDVR